MRSIAIVDLMISDMKKSTLPQMDDGLEGPQCPRLRSTYRTTKSMQAACSTPARCSLSSSILNRSALLSGDTR